MAAFKDKKNGSWYVQFRYTDWRGERQQKLKRGFATKKEAQAWEREFLMQKQADVNMSFESFVALYEKDVKPKLKLNTWLSKEHKSLVGTVKETIQQVSMSKKWDSKPALDENGEPILSAKGKPVLKKSYSVLQDNFFQYMRDAGYDDVERGERGSSEEHLTVTQFKVQQEQARLAELTEQNRQQEQQAATLGRQIEKIRNQQVDVAAIEKIEAKPVPLSSKVILERTEYESLATAAKKYVAAEKKESKLQKALDAANRLIAKLKAEITGLKQELSEYKSVRSKLRTSDLERENAELRGKVQRYENVIQRNHLWLFFRPRREKAATRDDAR